MHLLAVLQEVGSPEVKAEEGLAVKQGSGVRASGSHKGPVRLTGRESE